MNTIICGVEPLISKCGKQKSLRSIRTLHDLTYLHPPLVYLLRAFRYAASPHIVRWPLMAMIDKQQLFWNMFDNPHILSLLITTTTKNIYTLLFDKKQLIKWLTNVNKCFSVPKNSLSRNLVNLYRGPEIKGKDIIHAVPIFLNLHYKYISNEVFFSPQCVLAYMQ